MDVLKCPNMYLAVPVQSSGWTYSKNNPNEGSTWKKISLYMKITILEKVVP
jgi:hypothetical protein